MGGKFFFSKLQYKYTDQATNDAYLLYKNFKSLKPQDAKPYGKVC